MGKKLILHELKSNIYVIKIMSSDDIAMVTDVIKCAKIYDDLSFNYKTNFAAKNVEMTNRYLYEIFKFQKFECCLFVL